MQLNSLKLCFAAQNVLPALETAPLQTRGSEKELLDRVSAGIWRSQQQGRGDGGRSAGSKPSLLSPLG